MVPKDRQMGETIGYADKESEAVESVSQSPLIGNIARTAEYLDYLANVAVAYELFFCVALDLFDWMYMSGNSEFRAPDQQSRATAGSSCQSLSCQ
jgi:hypothetical protein